MGVIKIELPWPPSDNEYHQIALGRIIVSTTGKNYCSRVAAEVAALRAACRIPPEPLTGRLGIYVEAFPPDGPRRKRDIANLWKCLSDSIQQAKLIFDDEQFDDDRIVRRPNCKGGKVLVTIWELAGQHLPPALY